MQDRSSKRLSRVLLLGAAICLFGLRAAVADRTERSNVVEGLHDNTPTVHALINAKIVTAPGKTIEKGTLVIRDGIIEAVGADVKPPADARVWDLAGKTIYPGLIDAYGEASDGA